jgi:eukaryotic-like serine/threonine-protein kinase
MSYKIFSPVLIIIMIDSLFLVAAPGMSLYVQPKEAMAQTPEQSKNSSNFLTYENLSFGIKILYPANWDKQENTSSSSNNSTLYDIVTFSPPLKNSSNIIGKLAVKVDNISDIKPTTLANYADAIISDLKQDFRVTESNTTLSGNPAYKVVYTGLEESVDLQAMLVMAIKGDRVYMISYTAEPEKYSYYLPTVQKMIDSFEILN